MMRAPLPALTDFEEALGQATDPDLRLQLESRLLEGTVLHSALLPRRRALLDAGRADPDASPVMAAHLAMDSAYRGLPAAETLAYADRADPHELLRVIGPENSTYNLLFHAVRYAEEPERSLALLEAGDADRAPHGLALLDVLPRARVGVLAPHVRLGPGRHRPGADRLRQGRSARASRW